ncbi:MAG TPA: hypothetical protein VK511_03600 [Gemmatimonadaceae bacterium]|nr:hypothetical protein [Gemmatimonadaceae bacterium]
MPSQICVSGMHAMIAAARSRARSPPSSPAIQTSTIDASKPANRHPRRRPSVVSPRSAVPKRLTSAMTGGWSKYPVARWRDHAQ